MNRAVLIGWHILRAPIGTVLVLLEPLVRTLCAGAMVLGVLAAVLFELSAVGPRFPFLQIAGMSLGFGVVLFLYYGLLSLFIADRLPRRL